MLLLLLGIIRKATPEFICVLLAEIHCFLVIIHLVKDMVVYLEK